MRLVLDWLRIGSEVGSSRFLENVGQFQKSHTCHVLSVGTGHFDFYQCVEERIVL